jgi:phage replication-related protein YjqB (UPF0714/DUF867 family)
MPDKYSNFKQLTENETQDKDYKIQLKVRDHRVTVIAPHGGGIEPGTSEIAEAIAGEDLSLYLFEGVKKAGNSDLHITSTSFDEPSCIKLVAAAPAVIAIHGEDSPEAIVFLGGLDEKLGGRLNRSLKKAGFNVKVHERTDLQGRHKANVCNRTADGSGVQLELSEGLRASFFESLTPKSGRQKKTEEFRRFVAAVREAALEAE